MKLKTVRKFKFFPFYLLAFKKKGVFCVGSRTEYSSINHNANKLRKTSIDRVYRDEGEKFKEYCFSLELKLN